MPERNVKVMDMENPRISQDPKVMVGKPAIKGTRITVELILRLLGKGHSVQELVASYGIELDDIRACQAYAADYLAEHGKVAAE